MTAQSLLKQAASAATVLSVNQWYGLVIIAALVLALLCFLIGILVVGHYRRKVFNRDFMQANFGQLHLDTYNTEVKAGGYPDMGSGFYSQRLDYHSWLIFNKAQRTHLSYVETLSISLVTLLIGGLTFPITAAVMGFVNCLGRLFYLAYISSQGASHPLRFLGALMIDAAIITNSVFSFIVAARLINGTNLY